MSTQTPDQDQDPSDQANADELEETTNESADENNAEQDPLEQAAAKLVECEEAAQRAKDDLLRVQAEMQNVRRRAEQDVEKAHKYGQEKFSIELLAVVDNLERSLEVASNNEDETVKAIYEGVNLTLKSFLDCFTKFKIEAVDPFGRTLRSAAASGHVYSRECRMRAEHGNRRYAEGIYPAWPRHSTRHGDGLEIRHRAAPRA